MSTEILRQNKKRLKTPGCIPGGMQVWKCLLQQANYLNDKDKGVMAAKRSYSSNKYILLELDLNFLASVLKEYVWIKNSSSSLDTETKTYLYKKPSKTYNAGVHLL